MDYGVGLSRRFRALKLWFVLRYFGTRGIWDRIRQHVEMARELGGWIDGAPGWERMAPVHFSTAVFRYAPPGVAGEEQDRLNREIMDRMNDTGGGRGSSSRRRRGGRAGLGSTCPEGGKDLPLQPFQDVGRCGARQYSGPAPGSLSVRCTRHSFFRFRFLS